MYAFAAPIGPIVAIQSKFHLCIINLESINYLVALFVSRFDTHTQLHTVIQAVAW